MFSLAHAPRVSVGQVSDRFNRHQHRISALVGIVAFVGWCVFEYFSCDWFPLWYAEAVVSIAAWCDSWHIGDSIWLNFWSTPYVWPFISLVAVLMGLRHQNYLQIMGLPLVFAVGVVAVFGSTWLPHLSWSLLEVLLRHFSFIFGWLWDTLWQPWTWSEPLTELCMWIGRHLISAVRSCTLHTLLSVFPAVIFAQIIMLSVCFLVDLHTFITLLSATATRAMRPFDASRCQRVQGRLVFCTILAFCTLLEYVFLGWCLEWIPLHARGSFAVFFLQRAPLVFFHGFRLGACITITTIAVDQIDCLRDPVPFLSEVVQFGSRRSALSVPSADLSVHAGRSTPLVETCAGVARDIMDGNADDRNDSTTNVESPGTWTVAVEPRNSLSESGAVPAPVSVFGPAPLTLVPATVPAIAHTLVPGASTSVMQAHRFMLDRIAFRCLVEKWCLRLHLSKRSTLLLLHHLFHPMSKGSQLCHLILCVLLPHVVGELMFALGWSLCDITSWSFLVVSLINSSFERFPHLFLPIDPTASSMKWWFEVEMVLMSCSMFLLSLQTIKRLWTVTPLTMTTTAAVTIALPSASSSASSRRSTLLGKLATSYPRALFFLYALSNVNAFMWNTLFMWFVTLLYLIFVVWYRQPMMLWQALLFNGVQLRWLWSSM